MELLHTKCAAHSEGWVRVSDQCLKDTESSRVLCGAWVPLVTLDSTLPRLPAAQVFKLCLLEPANIRLPAGRRAAGHRTHTGLQEGREQLACVSWFITSGWMDGGCSIPPAS